MPRDSRMRVACRWAQAGFHSLNLISSFCGGRTYGTSECVTLVVILLEGFVICITMRVSSPSNAGSRYHHGQKIVKERGVSGRDSDSPLACLPRELRIMRQKR